MNENKTLLDFNASVWGKELVKRLACYRACDGK